MTASYFETLWAQTPHRSLEEERIYWDLRADEFNAVTHSRDRGNGNAVVAYLKAKGALEPESSVLDIGCGTGRYALEFAPLASRVVGLDVSPAMVALARQNAADATALNTEFLVRSWQEANHTEERFRKRFSLAFASMSPAIDSPASLLKMADASTRFCFMNGFVSRRDSVRDMLMAHLFPAVDPAINGSFILCAFGTLWEHGLHAEITYHDGGWHKNLDIAVAAKAYAVQLRHLAPGDNDLAAKIHAACEQAGRNGKILQTVEAKIAWLFWKV